MSYKINIRNDGNTDWINLLEAQYIPVADSNLYFTGTNAETILAELFENKTQRVTSSGSPTVGDDSYQIGTLWVNESSDGIYICVDNTSGAAIWTNVSSIDVEGIEDIVGGMFGSAADVNITSFYNDANGTIDLTVNTATSSGAGVAYFPEGVFDITLDGGVSIADNSINIQQLASSIDASSKLFNAYSVGGKIVNDAGLNSNYLWSSAKIEEYVSSIASGLSWQEPVLDKDLNDPPTTPTTGDRYLVSQPAPPATGDWLGHDNEVAEWDGSVWIFTPVTEGFATWIIDEDIQYVYNGTTWVKIGTTVIHGNLSGLQGGTSLEYYHLTSAEHSSVTGPKTANTVFAAPNGASGVGSFRSLVAADIPTLTSSKISDFAEASQDAIGSAITAGTKSNITVTYVDASNRIDFSVATATTAVLGVASFNTTWFTVTAGAVSLKQSAIDHGSISGLADDDHTQYMHNTINRTVSAQHTFNGAVAQAPFILGSNAQGRLVTGLNADLLNGQDWTVSTTALAPSTPAANDIWVEITP